MKKLNALKAMTIIGLLCFMFALNVPAQDVRTFSNNWGPDGVTLTRQNLSGIEVNFSISKLFLESANVDGKSLVSIKLPGIFLPNEEGMPDLAGMSRFIALPKGAKANFRLVSYQTEVIQNVDVAPAPRIPKETENGLFYKKDMNVYSKDKYYPENIIKLSEVTQVRGVDVVLLGITPFQYNPVTKELIVYKDLKVEVNFIGGNGQVGDNRLRSRWFDPILEDMLLNNSILPKINYDLPRGKSLTPDYEYLIIRPNGSAFAQWADSIKNFRNLQGIRTGVVSLADIGGNTTTAIETYVNTAYSTWTIPPVAVLLLGDYGTDANSTVISPIYNSYCVSDNIYADVDNNHLPDLVFARMTANDASQLQIMCTKFLKYERTPPTNPNFYLKPITALGWQTERWFQICSEVVGGFFKNVYSKTPVRINALYGGNPSTDPWSTATNTSTVVSYFGPSPGLGYIPATPQTLGGFTGGTAQMVVDALNAGSFMLQHRDHGGETGWGEPAFQSGNISQLTNTDLSFIFSINCLTGKYNYSSECFAEKFHRYTYNGQNSGCVGLIAASEVSYSFVNDTYAWGMYDNMWPNFMPAYGTTPPSRDLRPAFGNAAGKIFLAQSSWPYNTSNKEVTYHLFHMHGDAFFDMYSEVPQNLTVSHSSAIVAGANQFAVTANSGSFIALSINGTIIGTGTGTGSPVNITIPGTQVPGQIMQVVITKQNYYRYTANVNVIPASGAYVIQDSIAINDPTPNGNNNHLMDYGEVNQLLFRAKNVGSVTANNVTIKVRSTSPYVTMTDSTENFGNIGAGSTVTINNAFAYNVSNYLPDNTNVTFNVIATSGTDNWSSSFNIIGHAAILKMGSNIITDSTGNNNGQLDPGENAKFKVAIKNIGTSAGRNVAAKLTTTCPYITFTTDTLVYGSIPALDSVRNAFQLTVAPNTPSGTSAWFKLKIYNLAGAIMSIDSFKVTIGQILITIGAGSSTESYPIDRYYNYMRWQGIYTRTEIGTTGNIVNIRFYQSNAMSGVTSGPTTVYMKMVSDATLPTGTWDVSGHTTVYTGTINNLAAPGWLEITLSTPFFFNMAANQNLLISIDRGYQSYITSYPLYTYSTTGTYMSRRNRSDTGTPTSLTQSYNRANIQIEMNTVTSINNPVTGIPKKYDLKQNYPNPFNPVTKINFELPKDGQVTLKIFDVLGREVRTLVNEVKTAGYYSVDFDASTLSSGVYFYKMEAGFFSDIKRMVLIK